MNTEDTRDRETIGVSDDLTPWVKRINIAAAYTGTNDHEDVRSILKQLVAQEAKAFGGCRNCYGKGYATVISGLRGHADFGGDGFQSPPTTHIKYCSCDRGKQSQQLVAQEANKAVLKEIYTIDELFGAKDAELYAYLTSRVAHLTAEKEQPRGEDDASY